MCRRPQIFWYYLLLFRSTCYFAFHEVRTNWVSPSIIKILDSKHGVTTVMSLRKVRKETEERKSEKKLPVDQTNNIDLLYLTAYRLLLAIVSSLCFIFVT